jgi:hypothetical protein
MFLFSELYNNSQSSFIREDRCVLHEKGDNRKAEETTQKHSARSLIAKLIKEKGNK